MTRYLVFVYRKHDALGGMQDLKHMSHSYEEAQKLAQSERAKNTFVEIYDVETGDTQEFYGEE